MSIKNNIWVEKYRPSTLEDLIIPDRVYNKFKGGKLNNHVLLHGSPGLGKTSLGKIIAKDTPDELKNFIRSFPRQALHAHKIGFKLPSTDEDVVFESKIPKDFKELIRTLEKFNIS